MGVLVMVAAVLWLSSAPVAGQQAPAGRTESSGSAPRAATAPPAAASGNFTVAKTSWGDPDLRGIYNYATATPLQRPDALKGKDVLTDEEAEEVEQEIAARQSRDRRDGGAAADVGRAYNEYWMDPNRNVMSDNRTSLVVDPPDGRLPPRVEATPEVAKIRADRALDNRRFNEYFMESYLDANLTQRCISRGGKSGGGDAYLPAIYSNTTQIFQSPGYVVLYAELVHTSRVIPLDGRPHVGQKIGMWFGDARGRWEGTTLVVETKNFRPHSGFGCKEGGCNVVYQGANPETFTIVERFKPVAAGRLEYSFTVTDPKTWTRPFTVMVPWNKTNEQIYEYACSETNYDMYDWLAGARKREAAGERFDPTAKPAQGGGGDGG
jgi:hypothetical protein